MNNTCDEHGAVLSSNPQSLICPLYTSTRNIRMRCNSMKKQTGSCTGHVSCIYECDQRDFTIIENIETIILVSMNFHLHEHYCASLVANHACNEVLDVSNREEFC